MEEVGNDAEETEMFEEDQTPLFYSWDQGNYLQYSQLNRLRHTILVEHATHYWPKGLPFNRMLARMCYDAPGDIKSRHPE